MCPGLPPLPMGSPRFGEAEAVSNAVAVYLREELARNQARVEPARPSRTGTGS